MSPLTITISFLLYVALLFAISFVTGRKAKNESYFIAERKSIWYIVAYGMIGASLTGVTFMSVPGWVGKSGFSYMMVIFGYFIGYMIIAFVLLPLYYRMKLTSIYTYLNTRFGFNSHVSGSIIFIISRSLGSSLRMFLVVFVLQEFVFNHYGIPFAVSALIFIIVIISYTFKGGVKTLIWTDTLQTTFMLASLVITVIMIAQNMDISLTDLGKKVMGSEYSHVIYTDWKSPSHWLKLLLSGMFITISMTGLDQEMMQKNLTCRSIGEAQKNMVTFALILIVVDFIFLFLGASMFIYADTKHVAMPSSSDLLFPVISFNYLPAIAGIIFFIGLIAASLSAAGGAITSLTTSVSVDLLRFEEKKWDEEKKKKIRKTIHVLVTAFLYLLILMFFYFNNRAVIDLLFTIAGYTYGPLLGLFAFGVLTRYQIKDKLVPIPLILSPAICLGLSYLLPFWFGITLGWEVLVLNGLITIAGLRMIATKPPKEEMKRV